MKHIDLSGKWVYSEEPFPAFRCELVYGRNKFDRQFLPVQNLPLIRTYSVSSCEDKPRLLYLGTDKGLAEKASEEFKATGSFKYTKTETTKPILPENKFKIIKTKEKGTILIVPGDDSANRCLLFAGCCRGFRGGEKILTEHTTGNILKICSAGNNCESSTEVIVLLDVDQSIVFYTYGRRTSDVLMYTWNGKNIIKKEYTKTEWDVLHQLEEETEEI